MTIAIPALNYGNFSSVINVVEKAGGQARVVHNPAELVSFQKLLIAGVGAFDAGMSSIIEGKWKEVLDEAVLRNGTPVLGICLGMQLLCNQSEAGKLRGLGWIDADVRRIRVSTETPLKIPHMG